MSTEYDRTETDSRTDDIERDNLGERDAAEKRGEHHVIDTEVIEPDSGRDPKTSPTVDGGSDTAFVAGSGAATADETREDHRRDDSDIAAAGSTEREPVVQQQSPATDAEDDVVPLFDEKSLEHLRGRWRDLQGTFVDDPHDAVFKADELVTELIHELTSTYAARKGIIADRWSDSPDTESLRRALRSYRSFFNQLLTPTA
ncbi:hypothetical protein [Nocardia fluminea]|uniref:Uncharacterized protein n=1 Tax=Nocardia fluminea TaxID=134984 RepID=A0A2N3VDN0_9NOCA|nr:hypothetical protein [Nocardia fluminea]PKV79744.1 hypothetical protein ATK86_4155 [Nocardia fluminea]